MLLNFEYYLHWNNHVDSLGTFQMTVDQKIAQIDKRILTARLLDIPGTVMFGLAIYARFYANGDAFISFLNTPKIVDSMFIVGAVLMCWGGYRIFKLKRERARMLAADQ